MKVYKSRNVKSSISKFIVDDIFNGIIGKGTIKKSGQTPAPRPPVKPK